MTLRRKTLLASCLARPAAIVSRHFSANYILLGGFSDVETRETQSSLSRATAAVENELASLTAFLADWAEWDDSYDFIAKQSPEYIEEFDCDNISDTKITTACILGCRAQYRVRNNLQSCNQSISAATDRFSSISNQDCRCCRSELRQVRPRHSCSCRCSPANCRTPGH